MFVVDGVFRIRGNEVGELLDGRDDDARVRVSHLLGEDFGGGVGIRGMKPPGFSSASFTALC